MKKLNTFFVATLLLCCANFLPAQCLTGSYGLYPSATFTPNCNGSTANINTFCWAGEYSNVNVVSGTAYTFSSSVSTDDITIANSAGTTALATGSGSVTWTSTVTGTVRFWTHLPGCVSSTSSRTRAVSCGAVVAPTACSNTIQMGGCPSTSKPFNLAAGTGDMTGNGPWSTPGNEAVFKFTSTTAGNYVVTLDNNTSGFVDVFFKSGACSSTGWTYIDDISGNNSAANIVTLAANTTYLFLVDDENTTASSGLLTIACQVAPSNDDCSTPIGIACGQTVTGSTVAATAGVAPTCGVSVGTGGGVWYKFVGTGSFVTASTCTGTNYDSKLHVYEGSCSNLVCIDGDDDGCGVFAGGSSVTWCSQQGQAYYILVNGFSASAGDFALTMDCNVSGAVSINSVSNSCVNDSPISLSANLPGGTFSGPGVSGNSFDPAAAGVGTHTISYTLCSVTVITTTTVNAAPANDFCANAIPVVCGSSYSGNTECATTDALSYCGVPGGNANGVWYSFVGDGSFVTMNTCDAGTNYDTKLHVFEGSCGNLTCVTGNDDYFSTPYSCSVSGLRSIVEFCSEVGKTYYVLVSGYSSFSSGDYVLNVSCGTPLTVDAGDCQTRFVGYTGAGAPDDIMYICPSVAGGDGNYSVSISPAADFMCDNGCYGVSPSANTTYTVSVTDGNGCTVTDQIDVQVIDVVAACPTNGQPKVQICHVPPGNPNNEHNICVSPNAVPAHLAGGNGHGTCYLGPCGNACLATNASCEPSVCAGGTFTITVSSTGFLDETTWTFAGTSSGTLSSFGSNTATVTVGAGMPSEFCIETNGFFNDNDADYVISCGGGTIASGTILGGNSTCIQDICCNGIAPSNKTGASAQGATTNRGGVVAFPNPFTEMTTFRFRTATAGQASLVIFALDGKQVASVFEGNMDAQEVKEVEFKAQDLSSGTYLYRYISPDGRMTMGKVSITK